MKTIFIKKTIYPKQLQDELTLSGIKAFVSIIGTEYVVEYYGDGNRDIQKIHEIVNSHKPEYPEEYFIEKQKESYILDIKTMSNEDILKFLISNIQTLNKRFEMKDGKIVTISQEK